MAPTAKGGGTFSFLVSSQYKVRTVSLFIVLFQFPFKCIVMLDCSFYGNPSGKCNEQHCIYLGSWQICKVMHHLVLQEIQIQTYLDSLPWDCTDLTWVWSTNTSLIYRSNVFTLNFENLTYGSLQYLSAWPCLSSGMDSSGNSDKGSELWRCFLFLDQYMI